MTNFNPEKLRIKKINITEVKLKNLTGLTASDLEGFNFKTEQRAEIGFNNKIKTSRVSIEYKIVPVKDEESFNELSAKFIIDFFIEIDNYDDLVKEENGDLMIDNHLYANLVAVSFSTGRGIIYSKLHSTHLENIILPVIDPKKLIKHKKIDEAK